MIEKFLNPVQKQLEDTIEKISENRIVQISLILLLLIGGFFLDKHEEKKALDNVSTDDTQANQS